MNGPMPKKSSFNLSLIKFDDEKYTSVYLKINFYFKLIFF
jgi:hypothetical protein